MYLTEDWISCTLLQLLENQECCREKMSLDAHAFLKHLWQCWQIIITIIHEILFSYSCVSRRPAYLLLYYGLV